MVEACKFAGCRNSEKPRNSKSHSLPSDPVAFGFIRCYHTRCFVVSLKGIVIDKIIIVEKIHLGRTLCNMDTFSTTNVWDVGFS